MARTDKNSSSGCIAFLVIGAVVVVGAFAISGIRDLIDQIVFSIPWYVWAIISAVVIYLLSNGGESPKTETDGSLKIETKESEVDKLSKEDRVNDTRDQVNPLTSERKEKIVKDISTGSKIFCSAGDNIFAIDIETGDQVWDFKWSLNPFDFGDELLFLGAGDHIVYALDIHSGSIRWKIDDLRADYVVWSEEYLVFSSGSTIYAVEIETGRRIWEAQVMDSIQSLRIERGKVIVKSKSFKDYSISVLDINNGKQQWGRTEGEEMYSLYFYREKVFIEFRETQYSSDLRYNWTHSHLVALDLFTGDEIWILELDGIISSKIFTLNNGLFIGTENSQLYCFDSNSGQEIWFMETDGYASDIANHGVLLACFLKNRRGESHIGIYSKKTGQKLWEFGQFIEVSGMLVISNMLYYSSEYDVIAYDLESRKEIWRFRAEGLVSSPTILGDCVYFTSWDKCLYVVNIKNAHLKWKKVFDSIPDIIEIIESMDSKRFYTKKECLKLWKLLPQGQKDELISHWSNPKAEGRNDKEIWLRLGYTIEQDQLGKKTEQDDEAPF